MLTQKTLNFLDNKGIKYKKIVLEREPKWVKDIQLMFACKLSQILKTLLFIWEKKPILLVLQWDKKVDLKKVKKLTKQKNIRIASFDEVKNITWYEVNGIWPFGFEVELEKILDKSVFNEETITIWSWEPKIWLEIKSSDLKNIWDGKIEDIAEST